LLTALAVRHSSFPAWAQFKDRAAVSNTRSDWVEGSWGFIRRQQYLIIVKLRGKLPGFSERNRCLIFLDFLFFPERAWKWLQLWFRHGEDSHGISTTLIAGPEAQQTHLTYLQSIQETGRPLC
jgi:hypothetical protein